MRALNILAAAALAIVLCACSPVPRRTRMLLEEEKIYCPSSRYDLLVLREEKREVDYPVVLTSAAMSLFPVTAVVNLIRGEYVRTLKVGLGMHYTDVDAKIAEIGAVCGILRG